MTETNGKETNRVILGYIQTDLQEVKLEVRDIRHILQKDYVTKEEFEKEIQHVRERYDLPRTVVFSLVALMATGIVGALLSTIGI